MSMLNHLFIKPLLLLILGASCVLGFAPFYVYPVSLFAIAGFCLYLWQSTSTKSAAQYGFLFGLGLYGFGIYWIYICLHDFGGMPPWMAFLATFLLCAFMASFTALLSAIAYKLWSQNQTNSHLIKAISIAVCWGLFDWVKSWIFTGFPWLSIGYTQVPYGTLSGLLPIIGVYGVSALTVFTAALLALFIQQVVISKNRPTSLSKAIIGLFLTLSVIGWGSKTIDWSQPYGKSLSVDLLQGNISQDVKWSPEVAMQTIALYQNMILDSDADLIISPETALPITSKQLTDALKQPLIEHTRSKQSNAILGIVEYDKATNEYFNSAISLGIAPTQSYQKSHLVPFGEFIPFKQYLGWIYRDYLNMPMSDMSRGAKFQTPMQLNGQQIAINICYEDVFGEEIIRQLPKATLLVNITNDAWYGQSFAADQHLQFSQARALETARMVLRATNTGATAVIDPKGRLIHHAPHFVRTSLSTQAQGYTGTTPYVRWGNWPFLIISLVLIAFVMHRKTQ